MSKLVERVQHPVEVVREYENTGLATLMAKNIRPNRVDLGELNYMPSALAKTVAPNKLKHGDVLMTRTGANYGTAAPWLGTGEVFACADILILRQPSIHSGYLSSFLSSLVGSNLVLRGGYGGAQPHVAPSYLVDMPVPIFPALEKRVAEMVDQATASEALSRSKVSGGQEILLKALGLANWTPPEPLTYLATSSEAFSAGRLDAQYFMPAKTEVQDALRKLPGKTLGERFASIRKMMNPKKDGAPALVRNFDVTDALQPILDDEKKPVATEEIGSTKKTFKNGDVAISRLRAYLREIAVVRTDGKIPSVGSSEFIVLRPKTKADQAIAPETLLTFLRSEPVQTILKWCQDGSQHPRFSESDLLAIYDGIKIDDDTSYRLAVSCDFQELYEYVHSLPLCYCGILLVG